MKVIIKNTMVYFKDEDGRYFEITTHQLKELNRVLNTIINEDGLFVFTNLEFEI